MSSNKKDDVVLGDGAREAQDGDVAKAALPENGDVSLDATLPGQDAADTLGANAPGDDSKKGDKK